MSTDPNAVAADQATIANAQTRTKILVKADQIIRGDRAQEYGDAKESFTRIAILWGAILGVDISEADVARMMIALKISRLQKTADHADSWVDIAGYAALGGEVAGVTV